ncbi:unnamed protein product [Parnassius mnemosyne]|uniref:Alpha-carbonic anhydrase domain-containing protein n=1 Tax=Parnassius mnemosyne TaxID=213953 RepID=A0AAV1LU93_9NEOP
MVFNAVVTRNIILYLILLLTRQALTSRGDTQDQTSSRPNTLIDDADDLQRQLDNEAQDKIKFGSPKTIWVFHIPTPFPEIKYFVPGRRSRNAVSLVVYDLTDTKKKNENDGKNSVTTPTTSLDSWDYDSQAEWGNLFPDCKGRSQSPVDLPVKGFIQARGGRQLMFSNYDIAPQKLTIHNDGKRVILYGQWNENQRPVVYGGAAHSRRYIFHSLSLMWPSEHTIGGLQFPMESQMIHISAEYNSLKEALDAAPSDPQAFLGVVNLYKYSDHTQQGIKEILNEVLKVNTLNASVDPLPLSFFSPPFKEYACYQGSLTTPPCTESVLWLVRARSLPVKKKAVESAHGLLNPYGQPRRFPIRMPQPLNDRKIFLFY